MFRPWEDRPSQGYRPPSSVIEDEDSYSETSDYNPYASIVHPSSNTNCPQVVLEEDMFEVTCVDNAASYDADAAESQDEMYGTPQYMMGRSSHRNQFTAMRTGVPIRHELNNSYEGFHSSESFFQETTGSPYPPRRRTHSQYSTLGAHNEHNGREMARSVSPKSNFSGNFDSPAAGGPMRRHHTRPIRSSSLDGGFPAYNRVSAMMEEKVESGREEYEDGGYIKTGGTPSEAGSEWQRPAPHRPLQSGSFDSVFSDISHQSSMSAEQLPRYRSTGSGAYDFQEFLQSLGPVSRQQVQERKEREMCRKITKRHGLFGRPSNRSKKPETRRQFIDYVKANRIVDEESSGPTTAYKLAPPLRSVQGNGSDSLRVAFNLHQAKLSTPENPREQISSATAQVWFRAHFPDTFTAITKEKATRSLPGSRRNSADGTVSEGEGYAQLSRGMPALRRQAWENLMEGRGPAPRSPQSAHMAHQQSTPPVQFASYAW